MTLKEKNQGRNLTNLVNNKANNNFLGSLFKVGQSQPQDLVSLILHYKFLIMLIIVLQTAFVYLNKEFLSQLLGACPAPQQVQFEQNNNQSENQQVNSHKKKFLGFKQLEHNHDWNYYDINGGAWSEGFCAQNDRPSPMNLVIPENLEDLQPTQYNFNFIRSNNTIEAPLVDNQRIVQINGHVSDLYLNSIDNSSQLHYKSKQFHFHSPAEHAIDGHLYDLEMHIVHQIVSENEESLVSDQYAVIAYFFTVGPNDNPLFNLDGIDPSNSCHGEECEDFERKLINLGKIEQLDIKNLLHYKGSLTTPPCSPVVSWFINPLPLEISRSQLVKFKTNPNLVKALGIGNNREVQGDVIPQLL